MAARGLTDIAIRNFKQESKRREIPDPGAKGLYVVVEPSGYKSFAVRFRFEGKPKKLSLGRMSLANARIAAATALKEAKEGRDPCAAKKEAKAARRITVANTFEAIAESYLKLECGMTRQTGDDGKETAAFSGGVRSAPRRLADLERLVYPTLGKRPISEIKRSEIVALLDAIQTGELVDSDGDPIKGGAVMADRTLAIIRRIMNWHAARADDFKTPVVRGMARTKPKERERTRILTNDELRAVWTSKATGPFAALIRFLLLTGARRDEAACMTWDERKGDDWELPAARNKVKVDLVRPLSEQARMILDTQRREGSIYVFTTDGKTPISAFSKFKSKFDEASKTSGWTLHDLRRTARSLMSKAGVDPDHAERCLGHMIGGSRGAYDRHEYYDEKKTAYQALATLIERIANPPEDNVTPLRKKKRA